MPYIDKNQMQEKRKALKAAFPDLKMSITREHHSTIRVAILEAPMNLLPATCEKKYFPVNVYHIKDAFKENPQACAIIEKIHSIINEGNRIVSANTDYGDWPAFYTDIKIGEWDKEFKVKI